MIIKIKQKRELTEEINLSELLKDAIAIYVYSNYLTLNFKYGTENYMHYDSSINIEISELTATEAVELCDAIQENNRVVNMELCKKNKIDLLEKIAKINKNKKEKGNEDE